MQNTEKELKDYFNEQIKIIKNIVKTEKICSIYTMQKHIRMLKSINFTGDWEERFRKIVALPKRGYTLQRCIVMYGEELGRKKWKEYCDRQAYTNSQEYKKMSDLEFKKYNKSRAITKENMIKKYGAEKGLKKFLDYCDKQAYTNSLDYFCKKYGKAKGEMKWKDLNISKGHSYDAYIKKYGKSKGEEKYIKYMNSFPHVFYSNISKELFERLDNYFHFSKVYYEPKTKEFGKYYKEGKRYYFYDFVLPEIKLCIEFNGDYFHANPKFFKECDTPNPYNKTLTAKEIWEAGECKNNVIIKCGFELLKVWESDYNNDKDKVFNDIVKFIKERYEYFGKQF